MTANTNLGKKVSELPTVANLVVTDSLVVLSNTTGNLSVRRVPFGTLCANIVLVSGTPANSSSPGSNGFVMYDASYLYVYTPSGWLRTALASF